MIGQFSFAKRCIDERKRRRGKDASSQETAVLAFGSGGTAGGSNVQVVSRPKKGNKLFKVEG